MSLLVLLARWDRDSLSWKTSSVITRGIGDVLGTLSDLGMMLNGELFELPTSARRIDAKRIFIVAHLKLGSQGERIGGILDGKRDGIRARR